MTLKLKALAPFAMLALSACMAAPAASPTAGPGTAIVAPTQAAQFFNEACLKSAPSFAGTGAALAPFGFTQNSRTGTFYSNQGNMSFKALTGQCSMVLGLNQDPAAATIAFGTALNALAGDNNASIELDLNTGPDGVTYLVARTAG